MKLKNIFLTLLAATAVGFTMTGCDDDNKNEEGNILSPIAEHLVGRWSLDAGYKLGDDGKWISDKDDPDRHDVIMHFRPDGTMTYIDILPDGWTRLNTWPWEVNEADKSFTISGPDYFSPIFTLTENSFVFGFGEGVDESTGEVLQGQFKWEYFRVNENERTYCEKLVGKWVHSKSYEEVDGEWKETDFGIPDLGYYDLRGNGTAEMYSRFGDKEEQYDGLRWQSREDASEADKGIVKLINGDKQPLEMTFAVVDGNTVECYYEVNHNPATGETRQGKFKDVFVRAQE